MRDKDIEKLKRMLQSIDSIIEYCKKETLNTFLSNNMLMDACAMRLLALGEDSNRLSADCQKRHPQIDWISIYGLRNRIAHDYFIVDFEILWEIIQNELIPLKSQITDILVYEKNHSLL